MVREVLGGAVSADGEFRQMNLVVPLWLKEQVHHWSMVYGVPPSEWAGMVLAERCKVEREKREGGK